MVKRSAPRILEMLGSTLRAFSLTAMLLLVLSAHVRAVGPTHEVMGTSRVRQPVALAVSQAGTWLYVANSRSGSLSVIETKAGRIVAEAEVGESLVDLAVLPDGERLLAVDRSGNGLLLLDVREGAVRNLGRLDVGPDPVKVVIAQDGRSCVVASLWSRRLEFVELSSREGAERPGLVMTGELDLPFSPRDLAIGPENAKLIAADAFGGRLAVVDLSHKTLDSIRSVTAHNIRGLAVTPDGRRLVLAHQVARRGGRTNVEDVHWGALLSSHVRSLRIDALLSSGSDEDLLRGGSLVDLGYARYGAGDPAALVCDRTGGIAIALAGIGELAVSRSPSGHIRRFDAGDRPSALALAPGGKTVYVADARNDTIAAFEISSGRRLQQISLGPRPEPTLVDRGEQLFHDARLSHDGWVSCHSCHTDGHSNGQLGDTLGDGSYGAPKRVPSLLGVGATGPWAWNGSVERLEDQVRKSVEFSMRGRSPSSEQVQALTAYLRSLSPPRPFVGTPPVKLVERGRAVFESQGCARCHKAPEYTARGRYDVGLVDEAGNRKFNPPSLRGVGGREPLLHDGRAATLHDVFQTHRHPRETELAADEIEALVAYLKTL